MMKKAPCKECEERYPGCHDKCQRYIETKKKNIEEHKWLTMKNKEHMGISAAHYDKRYGRYIFPEKGINRRNRIKIRGDARN